MSDSDMIYREVLQAQREGREISDACARMIASLWHGGQASEGYAFASSGAITSGPSLWRELFASGYDDMTAADKTAADMFGTYLSQQTRTGTSSRGPVPGWSELWLEPQRVNVAGPHGASWSGELESDHGNGISRVRVTESGNSWHKPGDVLDVGTRTVSPRVLEPEAGE